MPAAAIASLSLSSCLRREEVVVNDDDAFRLTDLSSLLLQFVYISMRRKRRRTVCSQMDVLTTLFPSSIVNSSHYRREETRSEETSYCFPSSLSLSPPPHPLL